MCPAASEPSVTALGDPEWIDYGQFGRRLIAHAVTEARIEKAIAGVTGRRIGFGPISVLPARLAGVAAEGKIARPTVAQQQSGEFTAEIPLTLAMMVHVGGKKLRLEAKVAIELALHTRTAAPVLIVIDIPPVHARHVRISIRARAQDSMSEWLLDPLLGSVRGEIAHRVTALLADPHSRKHRVFDVEALVAGQQSPHGTNTEFEWIDPEEFGRNFFARIITRERIQEILAPIVGRPIAIGPTKMGPRDKAELTVQGNLDLPEIAEHPLPIPEEEFAPVRFRLLLPISLDIRVKVLQVNQYRARLLVPLLLTVRAADPLRIVADVTPPAITEVTMHFSAHGMRAATLGALARIKKLLLAQVTKIIRREVTDPTKRSIDVAEWIDSAF